MRKVIQDKLHIEGKQMGNCFAAVIACFLDCKISDIPPIEESMYSNEWINITLNFLNEKGWVWGSIDEHLKTDEFYIVVGLSKRGVNHCCIYQKGKLWHDPHPDQSGLITEDHFEFLNKI